MLPHGVRTAISGQTGSTAVSMESAMAANQPVKHVHDLLDGIPQVCLRFAQTCLS